MTIATKDQERDALKKIRKIVDNLGEQSYLATAFAGCFEDAEINIENDFADSMKGRWEHAEQTIKQQKEAIATLTQAVEYRESKIDELHLQMDELAMRTLSPADLRTCITMAITRRNKAAENRAEAEGQIVNLADNPESKEFRQAVTDHRLYGKDIEMIEQLIKRLEAIENAGA